MKNKTVALLLSVFGISAAHAQQAITTTGINASGSGGTVTSTVGQIAYTTTNSSAKGTIAQGVQQPYEIWVLGVDNHFIDLKLAAYPNPTTDFLTLNVSIDKFSDLSFELSDIQGKLIEKRKITAPVETIRMSYLSAAPYFLKVTSNNKEVKTFKIIKN